VGVAFYPENHFEAPSLKFDLNYLKEKVDKGASYVVTQMFFDNKKYFDYVAKVREAGIDIPIIPGIKPITTLGQITALPRSFFLDFPDELTDALLKCTTNAHVKEVGIEWAIKQCKELMAAEVPTLHFYTMSKAETTYRVAKELF
jgi:methylenetetrahydrofolate reductase (NADPH)